MASGPFSLDDSAELAAPEVLTRSRRQRAWDSYAPAGGAGLVIVIGFWAGPWLARVAVYLAFVGVLGTFWFACFRRERVELSGAGVLMVARGRKRVVPWWTVVEIRDGRHLGTRQLEIVCVEGKVRAVAPYTGWGPWRDPDYEAKAQRVFDWWYWYQDGFTEHHEPWPPPQQA